MKGFAITLSLLVATPAAPADWLGIGMGTAGAADLATTEYGLSLGARELNPLMQDQVARLVLKTVSTAAFIYLYADMKAKNKTHARIFAITCIVLWSAFATWNAYQIRTRL